MMYRSLCRVSSTSGVVCTVEYIRIAGNLPFHTFPIRRHLRNRKILSRHHNPGDIRPRLAAEKYSGIGNSQRRGSRAPYRRMNTYVFLAADQLIFLPIFCVDESRASWEAESPSVTLSRENQRHTYIYLRVVVDGESWFFRVAWMDVKSAMIDAY